MAPAGFNPGRARHRVEVQFRTDMQDGAGEPLLTWTTLVTRAAEIVPVSAREVFAAQQRGARVSTQFRMRNIPALVPRMRLVWNGKVFDVQQVLRNQGNANEMLVIADELVEEAP